MRDGTNSAVAFGDEETSAGKTSPDKCLLIAGLSEFQKRIATVTAVPRLMLSITRRLQFDQYLSRQDSQTKREWNARTDGDSVIAITISYHRRILDGQCVPSRGQKIHCRDRSVLIETAEY